MNLADTKHKSTDKAVVSNTTNTSLTGPWLTIARVVWLALVIPSLGLFLANLLAYYQLLQRPCVDPLICNSLSGALTAKELQAIHTSGFSVSGYAALLTISLAIVVAIWCTVGFLIFWRKSDDWMALLAAFFLVMWSITPSGNNPGFVLVLAYPILALPISLVSFLGAVSIDVFFLLFPNGRFVPRWMGLILLLAIINEFFNNFPSPTSPFDAHWPSWLHQLVTFVLAGATIVAQIYRYRRVSTPVQRQQTKWILLGVSVALGILIGIFVLSPLIPSSIQQTPLGGVIINFTFYCAFLLIPLSIGFSILRYRLYDIDVLINRTLVYGTLTILLGLVYFGLIVALQYLLRGIINQNNDVAIVVSTLAIAALFQPLRHRIQRFIDRRFYRSKYDTAKTLEAFSATLRNEVELTQLREHLVAVVQETMQPAHISLWLRPLEHDGTHQAPWRANPPVDSQEK